jgi:hypothetical protein
MFEDLILVFIEGYMEFCIAGYLQYGNRMVDTNINGEKISNVVGNFSIAVAIVFIPFGFIYMLTRSQSVIESEEFRGKYGGFYTGLKTNSKWSLAYFFIFVARRLFFLYLAFNVYTVPTL